MLHLQRYLLLLVLRRESAVYQLKFPNLAQTSDVNELLDGRVQCAEVKLYEKNRTAVGSLHGHGSSSSMKLNAIPIEKEMYGKNEMAWELNVWFSCKKGQHLRYFVI